jgi:hypothetical protein
MIVEIVGNNRVHLTSQAVTVLSGKIIHSAKYIC